MKEQQKLFNEYLHETARAGRTDKHVKYSLKIFFKYINEIGMNLLYLKIRDVQEFQVYLTTGTKEDGRVRFTRASVLNIIGTVSNFYEFLRRRRYIYGNPLLEVDRVRRNDSLPRNILNEENMDAFLKHLKNFIHGRTLTEKRQLYRTHVIAELMYSTGMRINEIASLKETDIDFTRGTVVVRDSKTGKKREAILGSFAGKVLKIYIDGTCAEPGRSMRDYVMFGKNNADTALLFGSKTNLQIWLNKILNRESGKLGLGKFTSHNFRHAVGYHLLRGGCDIRFIQEVLRHTALHSTQIYTKVDKEDLRNVIDSYHPRQLRSTDARDTSEGSAHRNAQSKL